MSALDLQENSDVKIAAGDLVRAEENVAAVSTTAVNPDRVLAAVRGSAVEGDLAALVAVRSVHGPCRLIPSALEVVRDLGR